MAGSVGPPGVSRSFYRCLGIISSTAWMAFTGFAQIQGSAGQEGTKPFTATVAIREGYDSNPLTTSYQSGQNVDSSTYTSIQPSLGYNYIGMQADAALRYDFSGTYYPSINQQYDIQYAQQFVGRYTYAFNPRTSISLANNFTYTEQPIISLVSDGVAPVFNSNLINNLATAEVAYQATDRLGLITRWNNTLVYLGGNQANNNYMNNGAFQQFRLNFTPETVGTFSFDYQDYDYDNDNTYRDNQQAAFSVGADHTFLPELFFSGRIGIQLNDNYGLSDSPAVVQSGGIGSGQLEIESTPFVSISSNWSYEQNSFVSAGFSMQVQQSSLATSSDSEAYTVNLNWDHQFTDKLSVIQGFFINLAVFTPQLSEAESIAVTGNYLGNGQQVTIQYQCRFSYQFFPYLSAELGWTYINYSSQFDISNAQGSNYNRNQIYLGVRGTY